MPTTTIKFQFYGSDAEGDYCDDLEIPATYAVCDRCEGKGSHVNPAIDGNGLSAEDFDEQGPDFREDYMR